MLNRLLSLERILKMTELDVSLTRKRLKFLLSDSCQIEAELLPSDCCDWKED